LAVIGAGQGLVLEGVQQAKSLGLAEPCLVGNGEQITRLMQQFGWDPSTASIAEVRNDFEAASTIIVVQPDNLTGTITGRAMATSLDDLLPTAQELREKIELEEAEKASEEMRKHAAAEAEMKALIDQLSKPPLPCAVDNHRAPSGNSGVSEEECIRHCAAIIQRAASTGLTEVQVYRFPNQLCTDHGRAINQQEPGWENALTGVPKEFYQFWHKHFRPRGYKLRVQIIDWPGGMPGDIGMTLSW